MRVPSKWSANDLTNADRTSCTRAHTGSCSYKLVGDGSNKALSQSQDFAGKGGDELVFRLWAKAQNANGFFARVTIYYSDKTSEEFIVDVDGTYDWQRFRVPFTAARKYDRVRVTLRTEGGSGTVWFDDVEVRVHREP